MEKNTLTSVEPINEEIREVLDSLSQAYKRGFDDGVMSAERRNEMVRKFWDDLNIKERV